MYVLSMNPKVFRNVLKHFLNCFIDLIETETKEKAEF